MSTDVNPSSHHLYPPVHTLFRYLKHITCGRRLGYSTNILADVFSLNSFEGFSLAYIFDLVFEVDIFAVVSFFVAILLAAVTVSFVVVSVLMALYSVDSFLV